MEIQADLTKTDLTVNADFVENVDGERVVSVLLAVLSCQP
jgi:hypothetical protein